MIGGTPGGDVRDCGFMGFTHALSALAATLWILAFVPGYVAQATGNSGVSCGALVVLCAVGGSLIPDLDNTASSAKSQLGPFGVALSVVFRASSEVVQRTVRLPRDDPDPNPHRGAWHTGVACVLIGVGVWALTSVAHPVRLPLLGGTTWGMIFAFVVAVTLCHLTFSTLLKNVSDRIHRSGTLSDAVSLAVTTGVVWTIFATLPAGADVPRIIGASVGAGALIHVLGDCFTVSGAPLLFPVSALWRHKLWWDTRFLKIKAGGPFENYVFIPLFGIAAVVAVVKLLFPGLGLL